jgi:hypothetical protein
LDPSRKNDHGKSPVEFFDEREDVDEELRTEWAAFIEELELESDHDDLAFYDAEDVD